MAERATVDNEAHAYLAQPIRARQPASSPSSLFDGVFDVVSGWSISGRRVWSAALLCVHVVVAAYPARMLM